MLYTEVGFHNTYADQRLDLADLSSGTSGEWAGGIMFGRVAAETRVWRDHLSVGGPCQITTAAEARDSLAVTLPIDKAATRGVVRLDGTTR